MKWTGEKIDSAFESWDKSGSPVNFQMKNLDMKRKYYLYVDESGEKSFELRDDKNYTIKKFNVNNIHNFGYYIWGGIVSESEIENFDDLNFQEEIKSSNFHMSFIEMIGDDRVGEILNKFDEKVYVHFTIDDIYLYILEDWIVNIYLAIRNLNENSDIKKLPVGTLEYEEMKSLCLKFIREENVHLIKLIKESSEKLFFVFYNWICIQDIGKNKISIKLVNMIKENPNKIMNRLLNVQFKYEYLTLTFHQLWIYNNSKIYYDNDEQLKKLLKKSKRNKNVYFEDSKENINLQISDLIIGLIRRFFEYLTIENEEVVIEELNLLTAKEKNNYLKFKKILINSHNKDMLFYGSFIDLNLKKKYEKIIFTIKKVTE